MIKFIKFILYIMFSPLILVYYFYKFIFTLLMKGINKIFNASSLKENCTNNINEITKKCTNTINKITENYSNNINKTIEKYNTNSNTIINNYNNKMSEIKNNITGNMSKIKENIENQVPRRKTSLISNTNILEANINGISNENMKQCINTNNGMVYLHIYIKKKYKWLRKKDELNKDILQIKSPFVPDVYLEDDTDAFYYEYETEDCTSQYFEELLEKLFNHCKDDVYITLGYKTLEDIKYKFIYQNGKPTIENADENIIKKKWYAIKEYLQEAYDEMEEHLLVNIKDKNFVHKQIGNLNFTYDDISDLIKELETRDISIFRFSYLEEVYQIVKEVRNKVVKQGKKDETEEQAWISDFFAPANPEPIYEESEKESKPKYTKEDRKFDELADFWGLSKKERQELKEQGISMEEFDEEMSGMALLWMLFTK